MPACRVAFDSSDVSLVSVSVHEREVSKKYRQLVHYVSNETNLPSGLLCCRRVAWCRFAQCLLYFYLDSYLFLQCCSHRFCQRDFAA